MAERALMPTFPYSMEHTAVSSIDIAWWVITVPLGMGWNINLGSQGRKHSTETQHKHNPAACGRAPQTAWCFGVGRHL